MPTEVQFGFRKHFIKKIFCLKSYGNSRGKFAKLQYQMAVVH